MKPIPVKHFFYESDLPNGAEIQRIITKFGVSAWVCKSKGFKPLDIVILNGLNPNYQSTASGVSVFDSEDNLYYYRANGVDFLLKRVSSERRYDGGREPKTVCKYSAYPLKKVSGLKNLLLGSIAVVYCPVGRLEGTFEIFSKDSDSTTAKL